VQFNGKALYAVQFNGKALSDLLPLEALQIVKDLTIDCYMSNAEAVEVKRQWPAGWKQLTSMTRLAFHLSNQAADGSNEDYLPTFFTEMKSLKAVDLTIKYEFFDQEGGLYISGLTGSLPLLSSLHFDIVGREVADERLEELCMDVVLSLRLGQQIPEIMFEVEQVNPLFNLYG